MPFLVEELGELQVQFRVGSRRVPRWPLSGQGSLLFIHVKISHVDVSLIVKQKLTSCPAYMSGRLIRVFPVAPRIRQ
jgi:hypothetical protein